MELEEEPPLAVAVGWAGARAGVARNSLGSEAEGVGPSNALFDPPAAPPLTLDEDGTCGIGG